MIYGITLIVLSILAVPSLLLSKRPDAKKVLDKIAPYQGWIGAVFCLWGVWGIIDAILHLSLLAHWPIWWITWLASSAVEALLGFILGYGIIAKYVFSRSAEAKARGEELLAKLAPIQGKLGIFGLCVGVWVIIASLFFGA